jgi:hypothetical protein
VDGAESREGSGMAIVDERRRGLGRFNPVDVFVFVLVVVMIPVAYGAYALFRTPPAKLRGVEPKQFTMGPNLRVRVNGTNLRPFMRVSFSTVQGRTFMIGSTETADIDLPDLEPGVYDVVLYDYAQELDRLPKALTILPKVGTPTVSLTVNGFFVGLNQTQIDSVRPGVKLTQGNHVAGSVLAVGAQRPGSLRMRTGDTVISVGMPGSFDLQAALELECALESSSEGSFRCVEYGPAHFALVAVDSVLSVAMPGGAFRFQVDDVHPPGAASFVRLRVHTAMAPDIAGRLRIGDSDSNVPDYPGAWVGRIESVSGADVVLRVAAQQLSNGWRYRDQWLKVGGVLRFETPTVVIIGTIFDLTPLDRAVVR